jgi:hypothetical protein
MKTDREFLETADVCRCCDCGAPLTDEEIACDRDLCFECYCFHQDTQDMEN